MNKDIYNILVTGACGVTSRSVVRALTRDSFFKDKCKFIGTDVCYNIYGLLESLYDKIYKVPYPTDSTYRTVMQKIIDENNIEYAIVIPEPEMLYWCEHPFNVKFHRVPPKFAGLVTDKSKLYKALEGTGMVPRFQLISDDVRENEIALHYPMWMRHYFKGTTSGAGAYMPHNFIQLKAWQTIHDTDPFFMLSEYLPGRNLACYLLYSNGELLKYGTIERFGYIMGKVSVSGITGNTCSGKLINDIESIRIAHTAISHICSITGETMNGLVVVDMRENNKGIPLLTEINIRHNALSEIMALGGLNFAEMQMYLLSGQSHLIGNEKTVEFPYDNIFVRDVDGFPIWTPHFRNIAVGECTERDVDKL